MPASEQQPERIEQSTAPDPGAVTGAALAIEVIDHALIGLLHPQDRHIMQRNQAFALARKIGKQACHTTLSQRAKHRHGEGERAVGFLEQRQRENTDRAGGRRSKSMNSSTKGAPRW